MVEGLSGVAVIIIFVYGCNWARKAVLGWELKDLRYDLEKFKFFFQKTLKKWKYRPLNWFIHLVVIWGAIMVPADAALGCIVCVIGLVAWLALDSAILDKYKEIKIQ